MTDPPRIDAHAHVWDRTCTFVPAARYHPPYEATIDDYLRLLDRHGIERAVLDQPSFLGTDNGYLLRCLQAHRDRLRGIVVVAPDISDAALDDMAAMGVIGVRYNLLSHPAAMLAEPATRALTERAARRGWWIEVHAEGLDWPAVLDAIGDAPLMVDHFGRPSGPDCPGLAALLARTGRHCVTLSAPYRQSIADIAVIAGAFLDAWSPAACLWASDWPWTQHEGRYDFATSIRWLDDWTRSEQRQAMAAAAPSLCGF